MDERRGRGCATKVAPSCRSDTGTYQVQPRRLRTGASRTASSSGADSNVAPVSAATIGAATASSIISAEVGLPGKTYDRFSARRGENRRFSRFHPEAVHDDARLAELRDGSRRAIPFAHRRAAGDEDRVAAFESRAQRRFQRARLVADGRQMHDFSSHRQQRSGYRVTVRVANLPRLRRGRHPDQLVAARKHADNRTTENRHFRNAERGEHAEFRTADAPSGLQAPARRRACRARADSRSRRAPSAPTATVPPSTRASSTGTTASAPSGTTPPVGIPSAVPGWSEPGHSLPIVISPAMRNRCLSLRAATANPSIAERGASG